MAPSQQVYVTDRHEAFGPQAWTARGLLVTHCLGGSLPELVPAAGEPTAAGSDESPRVAGLNSCDELGLPRSLLRFGER